MRPVADQASSARLRAVQFNAAPRPGGTHDRILLDLYARGDLRLTLRMAAVGTPGPDALECAARAAFAVGENGVATDAARRLCALGSPVGEPLRAYAAAQEHLREPAIDELRALLASANPDTAAEAAYRLALLQWNDVDTAADALDVVAAAMESAAGGGLCRLQTMAGWIEVRRGRYAVGARYFRSALLTYAEAGLRDEWLRHRLLHAASTLAVELIDFEILRGLDCDHGAVGHETREPVHFTTQARGWLALLCGRRGDALELFQRAVGLAESPALLGSAETNVAAYHRIGGALDAAREHLALARVHLRRQSWRVANADERVALLDYAIEACELDPFTAGEMLTIFLSSELRTARNLAFENDRRVGAVELFASGVLEGIHGRVETARPLLERATAEFNALGYRLKEAQSLYALQRIIANPAYGEAARRVARIAPQSWLAAADEPVRTATQAAKDAVAPLGGAALRVMRAICEGKTSREIATELNKSVHTVRNQTLSVYRALNVHTRAGLVAECARLGLLERSESEGQPHGDARLPLKRIRA